MSHAIRYSLELICDPKVDKQVAAELHAEKDPLRRATWIGLVEARRPVGAVALLLQEATGDHPEVRSRAMVALSNLYVAHNGQSGGGGTVLENYSPDEPEKLRWRLFGLTFFDMADVAPAGETDVFTREEHFRMDRSNGVIHFVQQPLEMGDVVTR